MKIVTCRTSLVVLSLRIWLPLQGTQVWSLDQEDPTCCGQLSPGTTIAELECPRAELCNEKPQAAQEPQPESSPRSLQLEKAHGATKTQGSQSKLTNYKNSLLILVIYLMAKPRGLWHLSSPTRDWTLALSSERARCQPLDCQGIPMNILKIIEAIIKLL